MSFFNFKQTQHTVFSLLILRKYFPVDRKLNNGIAFNMFNAFPGFPPNSFYTIKNLLNTTDNTIWKYLQLLLNKNMFIANNGNAKINSWSATFPFFPYNFEQAFICGSYDIKILFIFILSSWMSTVYFWDVIQFLKKYQISNLIPQHTFNRFLVFPFTFFA